MILIFIEILNQLLIININKFLSTFSTSKTRHLSGRVLVPRYLITNRITMGFRGLSYLNISLF